MKFISRAGEKLAFALEEFNINVENKLCADLGSSTGGFTGVLLMNGAAKVYSVDTAYGELDWRLRNHPKVIVMERTNALYVDLPEKVDIVVIDVGWTKQKYILPKALSLLKNTGKIISLVKLHYEAERDMLIKGKLNSIYINEVLQKVDKDISKIDGVKLENKIISPILGKQGKNTEYLYYLSKNHHN